MYRAQPCCKSSHCWLRHHSIHGNPTFSRLHKSCACYNACMQHCEARFKHRVAHCRVSHHTSVNATPQLNTELHHWCAPMTMQRDSGVPSTHRRCHHVLCYFKRSGSNLLINSTALRMRMQRQALCSSFTLSPPPLQHLTPPHSLRHKPTPGALSPVHNLI